MYLFQCMNPDCFDESGTYVFESKKPICPKCSGVPPEVGTVVLIHFAYYDKTGVQRGYRNRKFRVACNSMLPIGPWNCNSSFIGAVNCPSCKQSEIYKALWIPDPNNPATFFQDPNNVNTPEFSGEGI